MSLEIVKSYVPGAIGRITELHGTYYQQHAGFGLYFESKVARVSFLSFFAVTIVPATAYGWRSPTVA